MRNARSPAKSQMKRIQAALALALLAGVVGVGAGPGARAQERPEGGAERAPKPEAEADSDSGDHLRMALRTREAWRSGDFAALEEIAAKAQSVSNRGAGGLTLAATFYAQLIWGIRYPGPPMDARSAKTSCGCAPDPAEYARMEREWGEVGAKIEKWIALHPRSSTALIAKAKYFHKKAVFFRGSGSVDQVPEQAWPRVAENLKLEGQALRDSYAISRKNPMWYTTAASWMGFGNAPLEARVSALLAMRPEGVAHAEPFIAAMYFMEPRWGGSLEMMDELARMADEETAKTDFGSTYARVYWGLATGYDASLRDSFFQKTKADWPKMKQSFEAMIRHFPSSRNYSGYAFFACEAGEAALARSLLLKAESMEYFQAQTRGKRPLCVPEQWRGK